jgi:hypothetical protein
MGVRSGHRTPRWIIIASALCGLAAALLIILVRYFEIQKAQAEAERARIEVDQLRSPKRTGRVTGKAPVKQIDCGAFALRRQGRTWKEQLPAKFAKVELSFYQGTVEHLTLNPAWKGCLKVNSEDVVRFVRAIGNETFLIHDYAAGANYPVKNEYQPGLGGFIDVTRFFRPGENELFYYHEQRKDVPMGVVLRITEE